MDCLPQPHYYCLSFCLASESSTILKLHAIHLCISSSLIQEKLVQNKPANPNGSLSIDIFSFLYVQNKYVGLWTCISISKYTRNQNKFKEQQFRYIVKGNMKFLLEYSHNMSFFVKQKDNEMMIQGLIESKLI